MTQFGLTPLGFVTKQQQQIISEIQGDLQTALGQNINLLPEAVFGQIVNLFSNREALVWQVAEAVYDSQSPSGAEGTSVDNILALNNLRRLAETPTVTDSTPVPQDDQIIFYGLLLFGTPGTLIPKGSIIKTNFSPPAEFALDSDVTIQPAVNAIQSIFFSSIPTSGTFKLILGLNSLTTPTIAWNALDAVTKLNFASVPVAGTFVLTINGTLNTAPLNFDAAASDIQTAINALSGYGATTVSGSMASGFQITWNVSNPILSVTANSTSVATTVVQSVQSAINSLTNFTGLTVSGSYSGGFTMLFAGDAGAQPQPITLINSNLLLNGIVSVNAKVVNSTQGAQAQAIGSATCTVTGPTPAPASSLNTIGSPVTGWSGVTNQLDAITGTNIETDTEALSRRTKFLSATASGPLQSIIQRVSEVTGVATVVGFENTNEAAIQRITSDIVPSTGAFQITIGLQTTSSLNFNATAAQIQTAIRALTNYGAVLVAGSFISGFSIDFNGTNGGQDQDLIVITNNTTDAVITPSFGRDGKSFEIVVEGGADADIAAAILKAKPAGIKAYGSTVVQVFDQYGNAYQIGFSRPVTVPIFVSIDLMTDLTSSNPTFNPSSISQIQADIIAIGKQVPIGGTVIGFGSNGLIGAFNDIPGIISYTLFFGRSASPSTNTNVPLQPNEVASFETFNVLVEFS